MPYREQAPVHEVAETAGEPLARFDVDGRKGVDGVHGHDGQHGPATGCDGHRGGDAAPASAGESAGQIRLELSTDEATVKLGGEYFTARGEKHAIRNAVVIDEAGAIVLTAVGGDGGRGGNGGRGGDGARGHDGADATRWSTGGNGGNGGDGGNGGNATSGAAGGDGGQIVVVVSEDDTPLLMLVEHDVRGGAGGKAGVNGAGGYGGSGGKGGDSYSWSETEYYTDSSGNRQSRTHWHRNAGGSDGYSGDNGMPGQARVAAGAAGADGSFAIHVTGGGSVTTYTSRYDLRLVGFAYDSLNEDAVYEPGELVRVFDLEVENAGGMPTPSRDDLALTLARGGWIEPEPGELMCQRGLAPQARYLVPGELRFRIAAHVPTEPGEPLEVEESILQRAMLPSVRRAFTGFQTGEALAQGRFVIRYPLRVSAVENLRSLAPGEASRVRFSITNQSRFPLGATSPSKRVIRVRVATAPDSELGDEHVTLAIGDRTLAPSAGWTHELPVLGAGETAELELVVRVAAGAPEYLRFAGRVTLELGALDEPASPRPIHLRAFDVRVARPFEVSDADLLLVVNHRTTREEIEAWHNLGDRLACKLAIWDLSREGHLDLERPLADGIALADWFANKAIAILDNSIDGRDGPTHPHVFLADDQAARAAAAGIDLALIGHGIPLTRVLVPSGTPEVTEVFRTYWLRWWAKPEAAWLERKARAHAARLAAEHPHQRHVVVHRFAPELDGKGSAFANRWKVGTLETLRTLDSAAGAIVHASIDEAALHDPAYADSDHATTALLVMFGFDENLERLRRLLARAELSEAQLAPILDALVLDVASELAAVIAPGWMGDASGAELGATLPRIEALAASGLTAELDTAGGSALIRLAGRLRFVARSQVRWWEHLPPFRWSRRSTAARGWLERALDRFLAGAFGDHHLERARDEVHAVSDALVADHKRERKATLAARRRFWAMEQARLPIATQTITSDTELFATVDERVLAAADYDAVIAARAADAERRAKLVGDAADQRAALLIAGERPTAERRAG